MTKERMQELLKEEADRRREEFERQEAAQATRDAEILLLTEEQRLDQSGALWGETQFSALPGADEQKATDIEAKYVPDFRNPEKIAMMQELWQLVFTTICRHFGENAYKLFLEWLGGATVAELAAEQNLPFKALLGQIRYMVQACRLAVEGKGRPDHQVFPFREKSDPILTRQVASKRNYQKMLKGETLMADEAARVELTKQERELPLDQLWEHLKSKGFQMARSSAYRAKRRGWFYPERPKSSFGTTRVELTEMEKTAPSWFLKERFGVSIQTAREIKRRGWIGIDVNTRDHITIPEDRSIPPEVFKLPETTTRVVLTVEEKEAFQGFLTQRFGISPVTASRAKRVGWFEVDATNRSRVTIPDDRTMPVLFPGKKIKLTAAEKKLDNEVLAKLTGFNRTTCGDAKKRGYFVVTAAFLDRK